MVFFLLSEKEDLIRRKRRAGEGKLVGRARQLPQAAWKSEARCRAQKGKVLGEPAVLCCIKKGLSHWR